MREIRVLFLDIRRIFRKRIHAMVYPHWDSLSAQDTTIREIILPISAWIFSTTVPDSFENAFISLKKMRFWFSQHPWHLCTVYWKYRTVLHIARNLEVKNRTIHARFKLFFASFSLLHLQMYHLHLKSDWFSHTKLPKTLHRYVVIRLLHKYIYFLCNLACLHTNKRAVIWRMKYSSFIT